MDEITKLVIKAKNGDIIALSKLLRKTEKEIYSYLYFLAKNEDNIQDIIQETLLKITQKIKTLKEEKMYKFWVNKIASRLYLDYLRKNKKECIEEITDDKFEDKNSPAANCLNDELKLLIKKSISKLNEPYRMAILMREFEGLSYDEIAHATNTNVGTVKSRIARARSRLKEYILPYMEQK